MGRQFLTCNCLYCKHPAQRKAEQVAGEALRMLKISRSINSGWGTGQYVQKLERRNCTNRDFVAEEVISDQFNYKVAMVPGLVSVRSIHIPPIISCLSYLRIRKFVNRQYQPTRLPIVSLCNQRSSEIPLRIRHTTSLLCQLMLVKYVFRALSLSYPSELVPRLSLSRSASRNRSHEHITLW
jgi:hypothetical protein